MKLKLFLAGLFILWLGIVLAAFFIVQKPAALSVMSGLVSLTFTLLLASLFLLCSAGLGYYLTALLSLDLAGTRRLLLSAGAGMGLLGLLGFGLAVIGAARAWILLAALFLFLAWSLLNKSLSLAWRDLTALTDELRENSGLAWIRWFAAAAALLTFLLALAPPVEAFDALFYHLTVPALWLRDGGLRLVNIPHYWYPSLLEGMFVWPLAFGADSVPQLLHFVFGLLSVLLVWDWTRQLWGPRPAWWTMAIFLSMPSLPWLAAWAYTDLGLIFYSLAALYALWEWRKTGVRNWLLLCAAMTGLAMGIKYTSLMLPLSIVGLLAWWKRREPGNLMRLVILFAGVSLAVALPWYLRNWVWTGNPFYPFILGGPHWDAFRARWYAAAGTGIGPGPLGLLTLPFVTLLGYRDANYFDGRLGPLFLILFPLVLWILWEARKETTGRRAALAILAVFSASGLAFWTVGVIQSAHLWQARLAWPGIIPLILPMAAGLVALERLDTPRFKVSFIFSVLAGLTIFFILLDFGLLVIKRNPLLVAVGIESRASYASRQQPGYAEALALVESAPADAYIYFINEPRSYGMPRRIQPDPINDNLPHDLYLQHDPARVLAEWRRLGYTHILLSRRGLELMASESETYLPGFSILEQQVESLLQPVAETDDGAYILYKIPAP